MLIINNNYYNIDIYIDIYDINMFLILTYVLL